MFKSDHGELKQSVGLALQKANFNSGETSDDRHFAQSIPSSFFHWRFLHVNPDVRYETIGENIPVRIRKTKMQGCKIFELVNTAIYERKKKLHIP